MNEGVSTSDLQSILKRVEEQLAKAGELPAAAEEAVGQLLNVVEALNSDKKSLADEVERLRKQLEQKKKAKTTADTNGGDAQESNSDHSSENHRRKRQIPRLRPASDRRTSRTSPSTRPSSVRSIRPPCLRMPYASKTNR